MKLWPLDTSKPVAKYQIMKICKTKNEKYQSKFMLKKFEIERAFKDGTPTSCSMLENSIFPIDDFITMLT